MKVVIAGGGLIGMLSAWELVNAGVQVTVLEKNVDTGRESSWAGGGILSPLYAWKYPAAVNALASWSQQYYPQLVDALEQVSGIPAEYRRSGLLVLDPQEFAAGDHWAARQGVECRRLSGDELHRLAPALRGSEQGALYFSSIGQLRNPRMLQSLRKALQLKGVELIENAEVSGFQTTAGRVTGLETTDATYTGDCFVIAAGAWSSGLLAKLEQPSLIRPVRGQMVLFKGGPTVLQQIILSQGRYLIPRADGHILAGSTMEEVGFDKQITPEALRDICAFAHGLLPASAQMQVVKHWSGLRPGTVDGVPLVGAVPGQENLFINAGHFRNGVVMGPASAKLLMNIILDQSPVLPPAAYQAVSATLTTES